MTKLEIKTELQDMIYLLNTLDNQYGANRLKLVLEALQKEWNESAYFAQEIDTILNYEETMNNLNDITIYE